MSITAPSLGLSLPGEHRLRLVDPAGDDTQGDPADDLLQALAGAFTAALSYLAAAWGERPARPESDEDIREALARERTNLGLTRREAEVLPLLARGLTNREIAAHLVISIRTAEHHVAHIMRKLPAPNRRAAGEIARRLAYPTAPRALPG
jgi:DNA-binding NarL/FixJ family response regulator